VVMTVVEAWAKRYDAKLARRAKNDEAGCRCSAAVGQGRVE
jgi:hypothetical protein